MKLAHDQNNPHTINAISYTIDSKLLKKLEQQHINGRLRDLNVIQKMQRKNLQRIPSDWILTNDFSPYSCFHFDQMFSNLEYMSADKLAQAINWNVSKLTDCETAKQLLWKAPIKLHTITSFRDFSLKSGNL